jgi:hypothetical protein
MNQTKGSGGGTISTGFIYEDKDKAGRDKVTFYLRGAELEKLGEALNTAFAGLQGENGKARFSIHMQQDEKGKSGFFTLNAVDPNAAKGAGRGNGSWKAKSGNAPVNNGGGRRYGSNINSRVD